LKPSAAHTNSTQCQLSSLQVETPSAKYSPAAIVARAARQTSLMRNKKKISMLNFLDNHAWEMQRAFRMTNWNIHIGLEIYNPDWKLPPNALFECRVNYQYLNIEIMCGKNAAQRWKDNHYWRLIQGLAHEICHVTTNWSLPWEPDQKKDARFRYHLEMANVYATNIACRLYDRWIEEHNINLATGLTKK